MKAETVSREAILSPDDVRAVEAAERRMLLALLKSDALKLRTQITDQEREYRETGRKVSKAEWATLHTRRRVAEVNAQMVAAVLEAEEKRARA